MKVYTPKFLPMTLVKVFPKFKCNIYSDIDFPSTISVSSTGNNPSFTELMNRLAFVNFSSPDMKNIFVTHSGNRTRDLVNTA